jgi:hypothetical protein
MTIIEYPFPENPAASDYCVFKPCLEDDDLVFFHATLSTNRDAIIEEGFRIPDRTGENGLASVSFAKRSVTALVHAMTMREQQPGEYCIFAVRYGTVTGLVVNNVDIHDYNHESDREIIGCCTVPASYVHR